MQDDFRRRADAVRCIPLEVVLRHWGATRDTEDPARWHTAQGTLSVTGAKFFHWQRNQGGGGAIDLVMSFNGQQFTEAVKWLEQQFGISATTPSVATSPVAPGPTEASSLETLQPSSGSTASAYSSGNASHQTPAIESSRKPLLLPESDAKKLPRVRRYLSNDRALERTLLESLINAGRIYADRRGNAVFRMVVGKAQRSIGAELRGTGRRVWRGLAPGTQKDEGYFWAGSTTARRIVICESAIDAISCVQWRWLYHRDACIGISTAGVRPQPPWLGPLLKRNYEIYCGFDDDIAGNAAARQMIDRIPAIQRLRPPAHDWNDALKQAR